MQIKERFEVCGRKRHDDHGVNQPVVKDTDKDGLTDGKEVKGYTIKQRVMITGASPS